MFVPAWMPNSNSSAIFSESREQEACAAMSSETQSPYSAIDRTPVDPPSSSWLGHHCNRERVRKSGLWNSNHVDETYDPTYLKELERLTDAMELGG